MTGVRFKKKKRVVCSPFVVHNNHCRPEVALGWDFLGIPKMGWNFSFLARSKNLLGWRSGIRNLQKSPIPGMGISDIPPKSHL